MKGVAGKRAVPCHRGRGHLPRGNWAYSGSTWAGPGQRWGSWPRSSDPQASAWLLPRPGLEKPSYLPERTPTQAITTQQSPGRGIDGALGFTACAGLASRQPWRRCNYFPPVYTAEPGWRVRNSPSFPNSEATEPRSRVGFTPESIFLNLWTELWKNTAFSVITAVVQFLGPELWHFLREKVTPGTLCPLAKPACVQPARGRFLSRARLGAGASWARRGWPCPQGARRQRGDRCVSSGSRRSFWQKDVCSDQMGAS